MKYQCKCTPTQEYPHSVNTGEIDYLYWGITNFLKSNAYNKAHITVVSVVVHKTPQKSCDGHPIPVKKYDLYILGKYIMSFGKMVY